MMVECAASTFTHKSHNELEMMRKRRLLLVFPPLLASTPMVVPMTRLTSQNSIEYIVGQLQSCDPQQRRLVKFGQVGLVLGGAVRDNPPSSSPPHEEGDEWGVYAGVWNGSMKHYSCIHPEIFR